LFVLLAGSITISPSESARPVRTSRAHSPVLRGTAAAGVRTTPDGGRPGGLTLESLQEGRFHTLKCNPQRPPPGGAAPIRHTGPPRERIIFGRCRPRRSLSVSASEVYGGGKGTVCHTVAETDSWHENAIAAEPRGAMGITATPTSRSSASVRSPGRRCGPHRPTTVHVGRWRPVR